MSGSVSGKPRRTTHGDRLAVLVDVDMDAPSSIILHYVDCAKCTYISAISMVILLAFTDCRASTARRSFQNTGFQLDGLLLRSIALPETSLLLVIHGVYMRPIKRFLGPVG